MGLPPVEQNLGWRDAAIRVLTDAGTKMHYQDIAKEIDERGYKTQIGATPGNSLNTAISMSIRNDGDQSPFVRSETGYYILRDVLKAQLDPAQPTTRADQNQVEEEQQITSIIKCIGMYWNRNWVHWAHNPRILGKASDGATQVDFTLQIGIYMLHDRERIIYVGQTNDRAVGTGLGQRLYEHTKGRFASRWDRFSWFGLKEVVDPNDGNTGVTLGEVGENFCGISSKVLISAFEGILIEALEPVQNRKRGENFVAGVTEFVQVRDNVLDQARNDAIQALVGGGN